MPCGSKDKRRAGHRCLRCQKDHVKCDGRRPCAYCSARGVNCMSPPPTANDITIIEYAKKPRKHAQAQRPQMQVQMVQKPLVQDSWRYVSVFFQSIGLSAASPIISVFSFDSIGGLSQDNDLVNKTVSIVGGIYAGRNSNLLSLSQSEKRELHESWLGLKQTLAERMRGSRSTQFNTVLLCVLLSGFVELLLDKTGKTWRALVRDAANYIQQNGRSRESQGDFESALVRFCRVSDALGAILMCENVSMPVSFMASAPRVESACGIKKGGTGNLESLLTILEKWAVLQYRALTWACESENAGYPPPSPDSAISTDDRVARVEAQELLSKHGAIGIEIICQASRLQREIITAILAFADKDPKELDAATVSMIPYYHWGLTGLSRLFLHPSWEALKCELPVMDDEMIRRQAMAALDYAEGRLSRVELEAILYMPIAHLVGLEMRAEEERKRVMDMLSLIKSKGFDVASAFETDLQLAWTGTSKTAC